MKILVPGITETAIDIMHVKCPHCDCQFEMSKFHTVNVYSMTNLDIDDSNTDGNFVVCPQDKCTQLINVDKNQVSVTTIELTISKYREHVKIANDYRKTAKSLWYSYPAKTRVVA